MLLGELHAIKASCAQCLAALSVKRRRQKQAKRSCYNKAPTAWQTIQGTSKYPQQSKTHNAQQERSRHKRTLQSTLPSSILGLGVGRLVQAQADELIAEAWKLLIQLAVVCLGTVLLQCVHDGTCSLLTPWDQGLLDSS